MYDTTRSCIASVHTASSPQKHADYIYRNLHILHINIYTNKHTHTYTYMQRAHLRHAPMKHGRCALGWLGPIVCRGKLARNSAAAVYHCYRQMQISRRAVSTPFCTCRRGKTRRRWQLWTVCVCVCACSCGRGVCVCEHHTQPMTDRVAQNLETIFRKI